MIGWKDSDGDGVFDVLDVPLTLSGSGYYDTASGEYRFTGASAVQTLPNKNTSGLKNDITLNEVSRAQYRVDGGAWQTAATYGTYSATLDLQFTVPANAAAIEIRTIDDVTGITSPVYQGPLGRPASVLMPGINGVVWRDLDRDGTLDANERGLGNVTVQLVDAGGQPLQLRKIVEPDDFASTARLNTVQPAVSLSAIGSGVADDTVASLTASNVSTGDQLFASFSSSCGGYCSDWTTESRQMRLDFPTPVSTLSLDAIGSTIPGIARLEVFGADNQMLARYTTNQLSTGQIETMTVNRPNSDIKYAIARSHNNTVIRFDNLRFGPQSTAITDANGTYTLDYVPGGQYRVQVVSSTGQTPTNPETGSQNVVLAEGEAKGGVDFGIDSQASLWQNPRDRFDVNNDGVVSPNDVLRIINKLNNEGAGELGQSDDPPPYVDVNGDFNVTSNDVLQVINEINRQTSGGEGESSGTTFFGVGPTVGEGESQPSQPLIATAMTVIHVGSEDQTDDVSLNRGPATGRSSSSNLYEFSPALAVAISSPQDSQQIAPSTRERTPVCTAELFDDSELLIDDELVSLLASTSR